MGGVAGGSVGGAGGNALIDNLHIPAKVVDPQVQYLQQADLLMHQAIGLAGREAAAVLLFDAAVKALQLDMDSQAAISVAKQWAGALKIGG